MYNKCVKVIPTVTTIVTVLALTQPICLGQGRSRAPRRSNIERTYTNIRQVDFKNFDYRRGENLVRIQRGKGKISDGDVSEVKVVYGDLTGDGTEEAAVILSGWGDSSPGFRWQVFAGPYIYTLGDGRPQLLKEGDMRGVPGPLEAAISNGLVFIRFMISPNGRDMEQTRGLRAFRWGGVGFEQVDVGPPKNAETRYFFRLFNCDDSCSAAIKGNNVFVNADAAFETAFGEDGGWIDITEMLQGQSELKFTVKNAGGGIAYGILVARNDQIIFEKTCGRAGQIGCENNRIFPKGVAREFTFTIVK